MSLFSILSLFGFALGTITNCNTNTLFKPTTLAISPDPPVPSKPVNFTLAFTYNGTEITDGTISTKVTIDSIPLPTETMSLCDTISCPIQSGNNTRSFQSSWPSFLVGNVEIQNTLIGAQGEQLLFMDGKFNIASA